MHKVNISQNTEHFSNALETEKLVTATLMLHDYDATKIVAAFVRVFGSMKTQQSDLILAAAGGHEVARKIVELTVDWDGRGQGWEAGFEMDGNFVYLSSYGQDRSIRVEKNSTGTSFNYKVEIDCSGSPSQTAMQYVLQAIKGLVRENFIAEMNIVLQDENGVQVEYFNINWHLDADVEEIGQEEAEVLRDPRTVGEVVDLIQEGNISPVYTIHDELKPAQIEITWVIEDEDSDELVSLSIFVKTAGLYQHVGTNQFGGDISLPQHLLDFYLKDARMKRHQSVLRVEVESEEL